MRIVAIRDALVPIGATIQNAAISFDTMTASAVAIVTDRRIDGAPIIGYAFDSIGRYGKSGLLRERFIPRLLAAPPDALIDPASGLIDPERCWHQMMVNEKPGGHGERPGAVGLLDAALWDARAKAEGQPLWRVIADRYRTPGASPEIAVYGSCGHFRPGEPLARLSEEVARCRALGYRIVKIKLGGLDAEADHRRIDAALEAPTAPGELAVDANGMLDPVAGARWLDRIGALGLAWIEEPASPLDYARLGTYARASATPIATGENLFSFDDARNLLRYGALDPARDRIQIDVSLSYGVPEYARIVGLYEAGGWSRRAFWPHAGHLFAAQVVAGLGVAGHEVAPDSSLPYGGLWDGVRIENGRTRIPDIPGAGFEGKANLLAILRAL